SVERFPPRQLRRAAIRLPVSGRNARARAARPRDRAGRSYHRAVATALERRCGMEEGLQRPVEALPGQDRRAAQGVRGGQGRREVQARGHMSKPFAGVRILDFTRYLAGPYGTYQLALP